MKQSVQVPPVGESVSSGILATWLKQDGEYVQEGEDLFELETDKATLPVPAPASGVIAIKVGADEEVEIGAVVAEIDTEAASPGAGATTSNGNGGAADAAEDSSGAPGAGAPSGAAHGSAGDRNGTTPTAGETPDAVAERHEALSPAVLRALEEHGVSAEEVASAVAPSGKDGRLTKGDVESYAAKRGNATQPGSSAGRDAGTAAAQPPAAASRATSAAPAAATGAGRSGLQERRKMTNLRRRIAENLVRSRQESAHLTTFNEVDMSAVMEIRTRHKERFETVHGARLGFMSFFIKAAQQALVQYPAVNAFVDGTDIIYNHFYNIGVAISTDAGLIVPVIRNVDQRSFAEIEAAIVDFAQRAAAKRIMPDEFAGGTFSITNGGVFGSMLSTPIPSPPQTAVLGMHSITKRAVVVDDQIVIRPMMYLALTYDHRIIDGKEAIGFLTHIKRQIEDPSALLLEL